jgi:phosphoribosylamine---glycine ligase
MKVLVVGSGGREHALCWKTAQSKKVGKLYCAPGNGGIADIAECIDIASDDINSLLRFAKDNSIDMTVVGPEAPLTAGIVDVFAENGLKIFGPDKKSAQLEASKIFAKEAMQRFGINTADFRIFDNPDSAKAYANAQTLPLVIKADGLCAGKGVVVAKTKEEAISAIDAMMVEKLFGSAGEKIIIEECLAGEEASVILVSDGTDYTMFPASQDHKRVFDDDKGPNTGGMGAYSPAPVVTDELLGRIEQDIARPVLDGLRKEGSPYKGVLYIGIMIVKGAPYALEFNVRFGDPETQAILPRVKTDLVDIMESSIDGGINNIELVYDKRPCVCVVLASRGYPGDYKKGLTINGLDKASSMDDIFIFHAGSKGTQSDTQTAQIATNGGRVLGITAIADDIKTAIDKAYDAVRRVSFEGMHYRKDIGRRAIVSSKL